MGRCSNGIGCGIRSARALLYTYPIEGKRSFQPSTDPANDYEEYRYLTGREREFPILERFYPGWPKAHDVRKECAYWDERRVVKDRRTPHEKERDRRLKQQRNAK